VLRHLLTKHKRACDRYRPAAVFGATCDTRALDRLRFQYRGLRESLCITNQSVRQFRGEEFGDGLTRDGHDFDDVGGDDVLFGGDEPQQAGDLIPVETAGFGRARAGSESGVEAIDVDGDVDRFAKSAEHAIDPVVVQMALLGGDDFNGRTTSGHCTSARMARPPSVPPW